jgi:FlaA1/EpsC-like NDP-sugar epimerase
MTLHVETGRALSPPLRIVPAQRAAGEVGSAPAVAARDWREWQRGYVQALISLDIIAVAMGTLLALETRFGTTHVYSGGLSYSMVVLALIAGWIAIVALSGGYDTRQLGIGSDEFKRVGNAAVRATALLASVAYALQFEIARGFVAIALPAATVLTLLLRYAARKWLHQMRARGEASHRVLVIGSGEPALELVKTLRKSPHAGLQVLGICMPGGRREDTLEGDDLPVFGSLSNFPEAVRRSGADTVAVAHSPGITPTVLRSLAWELEGTGMNLLVAPALTNIAGTRISISQLSVMHKQKR